MYGNHLFFDDLNATGNQVRLKNKVKAKNLMMLAANFADAGVLAKIQRFIQDMSPEDFQSFQAFLDDRGFLSPSRKPEQRILEKIAAIALNSMPEDDSLRQTVERYNRNLEAIDELKRATLETVDGDELTDLIARINTLNDENVALLESISVNRNP